MVIYIKAILLIAVLFLAITFGIQNSESVTLRYYFRLASIPLPLYLVIYASLIVGIIAGMAIDIYTRISLKGRLRKLERANASLREDLNKLTGETGEVVKETSEASPVEAGMRQTKALPSSQPVRPENETKAETESTPPESGQNA